MGNQRWGGNLYFKYLTRKVGGLLLFFSNTSQNLLDLQLPPFYQKYDRGMVVLKIISAEERNKQNKRDPLQQQVSY